MAPERFTGKPVDRRADVYALACVLHELITGRPPFAAEGLPGMMYAHLNQAPPRLSELTSGLPSGLDAVVARGLAKEPGHRYPDAGGFAGAARAALDDGGGPELRPDGGPLSARQTVRSGSDGATLSPAGQRWPQATVLDPAGRQGRPRALVAAGARAGPNLFRPAAGLGPRQPLLTPARPGSVPGPRRRRWVGVVAVGTAALVAVVIGLIVVAPTRVPATNIELGDGPVAIAVSPDGSRAVVANAGSGSLSMIDVGTGTVTATTRVASNTNGVALAPDGRSGYVVADSALWTLDPVTGATRKLAVPASFSAAFAPDGSALYIPSRAEVVPGSGRTQPALQVLDTAQNTVRTALAIPGAAQDIVVSPDGSRGYLLSPTANSVTVVDLRSSTVVTSIPVGEFPNGLAVSPDGRRLYVTDTLSNDIAVIDTVGHTVVAKWPVKLPSGIAVAPDGRSLYVAGLSVVRMDTADGSTTTLADPGSSAGAVALVGGQRKLYVLQPQADRVAALDLADS